MSWIQIQSQLFPSDELTFILKDIEDRYVSVFTEAEKLNLISLKMLESVRQTVTLKSLVYDSNASIMYGKVYATMANNIIDAMLAVDPDFQVGGVPLQQFKFNL